jgi:hypothetical protein
MALAESYIYRLDFTESEPLIERIEELAEQSGSIFGRAIACASRGMLENWRGNDAEAEAAFTAARELYAELGNRPSEAHMTMQIARRAAAQGDLARAEGLLLEAVRTMKGLNDRARLCEAQRSLAGTVRPPRPSRRGRAVRASGPRVGWPGRPRLDLYDEALLGLVRAAQGATPRRWS